MKLRNFNVIDPFVVEFTKSIHRKIKSDEVKNKILTEGLYHFTTEENADKIMESGYIKPTKGIINNHGFQDRTYMFAGIPDFNLYRKNLSDKINPLLSENLEFSAIKLDINEQELAGYKERFQDKTISYKGRCNLPEDRAKKVSVVLDLNKENEYFLREKSEDEILNGYNGSEELLEKLKIDRENTGKVREYFKGYLLEIDSAHSSIKDFIKNIFSRFKKPEIKKLSEATKQKEIEAPLVNNENSMVNDLKAQVNDSIGSSKIRPIRVNEKNELDKIV